MLSFRRLGKARRYEPGQQLLFGITLFGRIVELFPYIVMATQSMEAQGVGRKLRENNLQRGRFHVKYIESYNPMNGQSQKVYQAGKPCVDAPTFSVTASDVAERASALPTDKVTLNFLTPTRISLHEKPIHHAAFLPIIQRLLERLTALEQVYGVQEGQSPADNWRDLVQLAAEVSCLADGTAWEELSSYSSRTKSKSPIGGFQGSATFAGDLTPFRELLVWGELIHVGKNAVKGNGWYKIVG